MYGYMRRRSRRSVLDSCYQIAEDGGMESAVQARE